jgi:putative acyl-CoA dehydrogenase
LSGENAQAHARAAVGRLAALAAAAALRRDAPQLAELFARTRLADRHGAMYGTSDIAPAEARAVLERALPGA